MARFDNFDDQVYLFYGDDSDEELEILHEVEIETSVSDSLVGAQCEEIIQPVSIEELNESVLEDGIPIPKWEKIQIDTPEYECNVNFSPPPNEIPSPFQYFKAFVDDNIIENIVYMTNLYSVQQNGSSINTSKDEILKFLGINILSSIIKFPSYRMLWATETRYPKIADIMTRNRFDLIKKNLHLNDNTNMKPRNDPNHDKLFKVRPFIDAIKKNFLKIEIEECSSIDEITIPCKAKTVLKQYNKDKPHPWGIKSFARCISSGILIDFEIYTGKGTVKEKTELGISGDIVVRLVKDIPMHENYKVYFDNWFSSYKLIWRLKQKGILCTGTVRANRIPNLKFKDDKSLKKEGRGAFDYYTDTSTNISVVKWYDNNIVHMISSFTSPIGSDKVSRWCPKSKSWIEVNRPNMIGNYNKNMGGVDLNDMLVALYRTNIGSKKYYFKIFYHFIDVAIVNAWLLYRRHCKQKNIKFKPLLNFRSEIADSLLKAKVVKRGRPSNESNEYTESKRQRTSGAQDPPDDVRYDLHDHFFISLENESRIRCRVCQNKASWFCEKCEVGLCIVKDRNCFKKYHKK